MSVVFPGAPNDEAMTPWTRRLLIARTSLAWLGFVVLVVCWLRLIGSPRLAGGAPSPPELSRPSTSSCATLQQGVDKAVPCTDQV